MQIDMQNILKFDHMLQITKQESVSSNPRVQE